MGDHKKNRGNGRSFIQDSNEEKSIWNAEVGVKIARALVKNDGDLNCVVIKGEHGSRVEALIMLEILKKEESILILGWIIESIGGNNPFAVKAAEKIADTCTYEEWERSGQEFPIAQHNTLAGKVIANMIVEWGKTLGPGVILDELCKAEENSQAAIILAKGLEAWPVSDWVFEALRAVGEGTSEQTIILDYIARNADEGFIEENLLGDDFTKIQRMEEIVERVNGIKKELEEVLSETQE